MDETNLREILKTIRKELHTILVKNTLINTEPDLIQKLYTWLFLYNRSSDTLRHWIIDPNDYEDHISHHYQYILDSTSISGGNGTIGYILKSGNIDIVNNTFLDPRGTVSYEDELIKNYSWAGIPLPIGTKSEEVQCVFSFYYQKFDVFKLEKNKQKTIKVLEEFFKNYQDILLLHRKVNQQEQVNSILLNKNSRESGSGYLSEISDVMKINVVSYYVASLSTNEDKTFKLDDIYFNIPMIENRLKNILNWCSISGMKCCKNCMKLNILSKTKSCMVDTSSVGDDCILKKEYYKYLNQIYILPVSLNRYKLIFYFSCHLEESYCKLIKSIFNGVNQNFIEPILELQTYSDTINKIDDKIKYEKRCKETIQLISSCFVKTLFGSNRNQSIDNIRDLIEALSISVSLIKPNKLEIIENIKENFTKCLELINKQIDNIKEEGDISRTLLVSEFWEHNTDSITINEIDSLYKMKDTIEKIPDIELHSNISVLKRAINFERFYDRGTEIFETYPPLFAKDLVKITSKPKWNKDKKELQICGHKIIWEYGNTNYLHFIFIHPLNFSKIILDNIQKNYKKVEFNNIYKTFIDEGKYIYKEYRNHFLYPPKEQLDGRSINEKFLVAGIEEKNEPSREIQNTISLYTENLYTYYNLLEEQEKRRNHSLKSAIAAIMSRNGSHNIGSHVLSAVSEKFTELPDSQILFKYIQQRMDFIAQITTEFPQWSSPMWLVRDIMRRFYMQRSLLTYIAQSELISAYEFQDSQPDLKNQMIIKIIDKDFNIIIDEKNDQPGKIKNDVQVAIPGGIVGSHAFYTILENIIRNSAKHSWKPDDINFILYIQFNENNDPYKEFVTIRIFDNVTYGNKKKEIKEFIESINNNIMNSFVSENGELKKENWGIAEIKISSGFLKNDSILTIGGSGNELLYNNDNGNGLVRFDVFQYRDNENYLGYEFSIPKPREVLIINSDIVDENIIKKARFYNIYISKSLDPLPSKRDYEFMILNDESYQKIVDRSIDIEMLPFRLFLISDKEGSEYPERLCILQKNIFDNLENNDLEIFKLKLYRKWLEFYNPDLKNSEYHLYISTVPTTSSSSSQILDINEKLKILFKKRDSFQGQSFSRMFINLADINDNMYNEIVKLIDMGQDFNDFIKSLYPNENNDRNIKIQETVSLIDKALDIFLNKYSEDIETLPLSFTSSITNEGVSNMKFMELCNFFYNDQYRNEELLENIILEEREISLYKNTETNHTGILLKRHLELVRCDFIQNIYVEALSGSQHYFNLLESDLNRYQTFKLLFQIIENAFTNILIIDERVSDYFYSLSPKKQELFIKARITIPHSIKFMDSDNKEQFEILSKTKGFKLSKYVDTFDEILLISSSNNFLSKFNFLIIHQGVLDKIWKTKQKMKEELQKLKKLIPFIVITSGRGTPSELPTYEKFIPFSDVSEFILKEHHEKILLLNNLFKIVAKEKNNEQSLIN